MTDFHFWVNYPLISWAVKKQALSNNSDFLAYIWCVFTTHICLESCIWLWERGLFAVCHQTCAWDREIWTAAGHWEELIHRSEHQPTQTHRSFPAHVCIYALIITNWLTCALFICSTQQQREFQSDQNLFYFQSVKVKREKYRLLDVSGWEKSSVL